MPILCEMIEQRGSGWDLVYIISMKRLIQRNTGAYRKLSSITRRVKSKRQRGCRHCLAEIMQQNIAILYQHTIVKVNARQIPGIKVITQIPRNIHADTIISPGRRFVISPFDSLTMTEPTYSLSNKLSTHQINPQLNCGNCIYTR